MNALEFPFLFMRDGQEIARVPVAVDADDALHFVADIAPGETFRIAYGNPAAIIGNATQLAQELREFSPEVIFLYSCGCRRFLMQEDVDEETGCMQAVAPAFGFYTYGEFHGDASACTC